MKKLFILLFGLFIFVSCTTTSSFTDVEKKINIYDIDFREYTDKGFLFMSDSYNGEYYTLGIIRTELRPEVTYKINGGLFDGYFVTKIGRIDGNIDGHIYYQFVSKETPQELVKHIYDKSIEWGGDGFHKFNYELKKSYTDFDDHRTIYFYYEITGEIIKRK